MSFGRLHSVWKASRKDETDLFENGRSTEKGRAYQFTEEMVTAIDVAIELGRPLLVSGEPGCGKTELGYAIARRLGIGDVYLFTSKSGSEANELFYTYDAVQRFRDARIGFGKRRTNMLAATDINGEGTAAEALDTDVGDYIEFQALGRAILNAHERADIVHLLRGRNATFRLPGSPSRASVVIIDEIDKSPRDFPNDLLHEIESMSFRVREFPSDLKDPETPPGQTIVRDRRPIVVITSNEERQLPDAFLRRCVFFEIPFPNAELLKHIIDKGLGTRLVHMGLLPSDFALPSTQTDDLVDLVLRFRDREPDKRPGISELLDAAAILAVRREKNFAITQPVLAKLKRDKQLFARLLEDTRK